MLSAWKVEPVAEQAVAPEAVCMNAMLKMTATHVLLIVDISHPLTTRVVTLTRGYTCSQYARGYAHTLDIGLPNTFTSPRLW